MSEEYFPRKTPRDKWSIMQAVLKYEKGGGSATVDAQSL